MKDNDKLLKPGPYSVNDVINDIRWSHKHDGVVNNNNYRCEMQQPVTTKVTEKWHGRCRKTNFEIVKETILHSREVIKIIKIKIIGLNSFSVLYYSFLLY